MMDKKSNASEIIERLSSAYRVTTQRALAGALGVPSNNVSAWVQRNSVPGSAIIKCVLDTTADLNWLVTGKLEKASLDVRQTLTQGKALYDELLSNGGKPVLRRIMDAYGFTLQKQLCELLGISSGTVSTWVRREYFPGDVVVACALDTGVPLLWLATGKGESKDVHSSEKSDTTKLIPKFRLESGKLKESGSWAADFSLLNTTSAKQIYIEGIKFSWLVDNSECHVGNGRWVVNVDGTYEVFDIIRLPGGRLELSNEKIKFECSESDVSIFGSVIFTLERHI